MYLRLINIISLAIIFMILYIFLYNIPSYHIIFNWAININYLWYVINIPWWKIMNYWFIFYFVFYSIYFLVFQNNYWKPYYFWTWLVDIILQKKISEIQKQSILNILVKIVFLPLMFYWFFTNLQWVINTISNIIVYMKNYENIYMFYRRHLHWLLFNVIFFIDVSIFLFWYSVESKKLNNVIKSVEPTALWWLVALLCYPLLNTVTDKFFKWYSSNFPDFVNYFGNQIIYYKISALWWIVFILLMVVYVRASVALWFKASNLTNRWIVKTWPYKYMRHPAYITKNLARMIWASPLIFITIKNGQFDKLFAILFSLLWRMLIYHMRALTEEWHLESDKDYIEYKKQVPNRYLPSFNNKIK